MDSHLQPPRRLYHPYRSRSLSRSFSLLIGHARPNPREIVFFLDHTSAGGGIGVGAARTSSNPVAVPPGSHAAHAGLLGP